MRMNVHSLEFESVTSPEADALVETASEDFLGGQALSRADRRDQQTQRILEAAKACFVRSGFQGASMHQICAEAGMSPGALYRYFPSKEAIVEAICEADRREDAEIFEVVLQTPDVVEGIVMGAMAHIRHIHENGAAALFAEICAEAMRNQAIENTCMKNMQQVQDMFRDYLGKAKERGEIDPPVELDVLLPTLMAVAHGMALNDLPSMGVPLEKLEILVRATVEGMLRPIRAERRSRD
jgi:TetR/AcrR family transcriptional repressor of uid operon